MLSKDFLSDDLYFAERFTKAQAYFDLCYNAAYKPRTFLIRGNKVELGVGQLAISLRELASRWQWSVNTVVKYLKELEDCDYIDTQKTPVIQVITVKKYLILNTQNDTQNDTPIIKDNKVDKNKNKEEEKENLQKEKDELFEQCWKAYNRKGSKKKSLEQWKKLKENETQLVLPHVRMYVASRELQYQKDFERYLRDRTFMEVIIRGNQTIYDPQQVENEPGYQLDLFSQQPREGIIIDGQLYR